VDKVTTVPLEEKRDPFLYAERFVPLLVTATLTQFVSVKYPDTWKFMPFCPPTPYVLSNQRLLLASLPKKSL